MAVNGNKYNRLLQDFDKLILQIRRSTKVNLCETETGAHRVP